MMRLLFKLRINCHTIVCFLLLFETNCLKREGISKLAKSKTKDKPDDFDVLKKMHEHYMRSSKIKNESVIFDGYLHHLLLVS